MKSNSTSRVNSDSDEEMNITASTSIQSDSDVEIIPTPLVFIARRLERESVV